MVASNIIREYLVRLGFNVDSNSLTRALDVVNFGSDRLNSLSSKMTTNFAKGVAGVLTFVSAAVVGVGKLVTSVADADLATQNAANAMYMNSTAYTYMQDAVKSLGYSMNDLATIARNPELTNRFAELVELGKQTSAPQDLSSMLKQVRDVTFEFDKMRVIATNGVRQIVYYFLKYLGGDLGNMQETLANFNKKLQENLPKIANTIAKVLYVIYRVGKAIYYVVSTVGKFISSVFSFLKKFPNTFKVFIGTIAAILLVLNPVLTLILVGISAIVLLIDDYMTWKRGGNSLLGDKWAGFDSFLSKANTVATFIFNGIEKSVTRIIEDLKPFFQWMYDIFKTIFGWIGDAIDWVNNTLFPNATEGAKAAGLIDENGTTKDMLKYANDFGKDISITALGGNPIKAGMKVANEISKGFLNLIGVGQKEKTNADKFGYSYNQNIYINGDVSSKETNKINQYSKNALNSLSSSSVTK